MSEAEDKILASTLRIPPGKGVAHPHARRARKPAINLSAIDRSARDSTKPPPPDLFDVGADQIGSRRERAVAHLRPGEQAEFRELVAELQELYARAISAWEIAQGRPNHSAPPPPRQPEEPPHNEAAPRTDPSAPAQGSEHEEERERPVSGPEAEPREKCSDDPEDGSVKPDPSPDPSPDPEPTVPARNLPDPPPPEETDEDEDGDEIAAALRAAVEADAEIRQSDAP